MWKVVVVAILALGLGLGLAQNPGNAGDAGNDPNVSPSDAQTVIDVLVVTGVI